MTANPIRDRIVWPHRLSIDLGHGNSCIVTQASSSAFGFPGGEAQACARGFNDKDMRRANIARVHTAPVVLASEMKGAIEEVGQPKSGVPTWRLLVSFAAMRALAFGERIPSVRAASHCLRIPQLGGGN